MGVSLTKGQRISLEKSGGGQLTQVAMGLGWDVAGGGSGGGFMSRFKQPASVDLDASCLLFDAGKNLVDQVWFRQLDSHDRSVHHTGDNLTGAGEGDDEVIEVDLSRVPATVQTLVFTVNSFTGQNFSQVANAFCRLVDRTNGQEIARYDLSSQGNHTAQVMARVYRDNAGGWKMHAIGENCSGRTFQDLLPYVTPYL